MVVRSFDKARERMTAEKVAAGGMGFRSEAELDTLIAIAAVSLALAACWETQSRQEWRLPAMPRVGSSGKLAQQEGAGQ